ncbi:FAD synthetase [Sporothrix schenckii 1099-18]|uniref:FAD synthase n=1 Tax=Sporothrix schenckii 1099-18 TaxID=1397361 RepID=A0A0F2MHK3_SPOSC|nr:FAD synthetase [Sporothrix schenckii 1099-18]KJR88529.1 FAD synthetase [Sporothrix schenckii 1099-18]
MTDQTSGRPSAGDGTSPNGIGPHTNGAGSGDGHPLLASSQPAAAAQAHHFPDVCYKLRHKVLAFLDEEIPASEKILRNVQNQVRISVSVVEQALRRYTLDQISLSYNGGKDCLVLLILILACLPVVNEPAVLAGKTSEGAQTSASTATRATAPTSQTSAQPTLPPPTATATATSPRASTAPRPFQAIYIVPPDPFAEVDEFVDQSTADYHLDLARYPLPMRAALDAYLADRPAVQAIFMGTRRTDPHGELLTHFTPTDAGWPQFMRIHPVIDWHYAEIWAFIRHFDIPFCQLYNRGFTSLGGTTDTRPNPVLAKKAKSTHDAEDHSGASTPMSFRPAYELMDDDEERLGRGRPHKQTIQNENDVNDGKRRIVGEKQYQ